MAITPLKVLLFLAGAMIAGSGAAYFSGAFDPALEGGQGEVAATHDPIPDPSAEDGAASGANASEDVIVPTFDVVRVEPSGSMVVAGKAAPGSEVEIVSGSSVLAVTEAGPSGDFAAVLEEALEPGEYNIVLRSTSSDNVVATSVETAVVSIPTDDSGQVVALVQEPGEPSRFISVPHAGEAADDAASAEGSPEAGGARSSENGIDSGSPGSGPASVGSLPEMAEGEPQAGSRQGGETAEPTGNTAESATATADESEPSSVFIEAVEIDGREVFVAGRAEPGRQLRIYFNDLLIGQTAVSPTGRFLVQAERDLPVGDYIVRADLLDDDGATVIARAAVPFERHTGDKIAAVAPRPEKTKQDGSDADRHGDEATGGIGTFPSDKAPAGDGARPQPRSDGAEGGRRGTAERDIVRQNQGDRAGNLAPPLEPVEGSVIIRRGDTLWQISRRVYGRGIRYTTIYLANREQIEDPDLIWPGQIFSLPEETTEGEDADLGAIDGQVVPSSMAAGDTSR